MPYKQELINSYDIRSDTLHMGTTDLGKTFGIVDMYKDSADATDVYRVEKSFSKLESDAARVFGALDDAEKLGRPSVELVRSQLNTLRKFLFLTHYRNGGHSRQYIDGGFDRETAAMVEQYRAEHGLADTRAVWLRNVALLLEDEHWAVATDERLMWTARTDYKLQAWDMQLGLYRAPPGTEFVLTENGLGLTEGAATSLNSFFDTFLGSSKPSYLTLTQSFPITPTLVVMLRSTLLSQEAGMIAGGMSPEEAKRRIYGSLGLSHTSYFHDLPRTATKTTYIPRLPADATDFVKDASEMTAVDRRKREDFDKRGLLNGIPLHSRLRDRFVFAIDNLTQDQVGRVNTLLLTHCKETISFLTPSGLLKAIGAFERDKELTRLEKQRYASLKAKLEAEQASTASRSETTPLAPVSGPS